MDYATHQRDPIQATREHIVPKSQFGSGAQRNITVACQQCNHTRGSRMDWVPYNELAKPETVITAHQWAHLTMIFRLPAPVAAKKRPA